MLAYNGVFQDTQGNGKANATIRVYLAGTNNYATIYSAAGAPINQVSAPLKTDAKGQYVFRADDGTYDIAGAALSGETFRRLGVEHYEVIPKLQSIDASRRIAESAAAASGLALVCDTKAQANAVLAALEEGDLVEVQIDESIEGARTRYRKESGAYVLKLNMGALEQERQAAERYADGRSFLLSFNSSADAGLWDISNLTLTQVTVATGTGNTSGSNQQITGFAATLSMPTTGMRVSGPGIAAGAKVTSVAAGVVNLSIATTSPNTGGSYTFSWPALTTTPAATGSGAYTLGSDVVAFTPTGSTTIADLLIGQTISSTNGRLAAGTTIKAISGSAAPYSVQLSLPAISTGTGTTTCGGEQQVSYVRTRAADITDVEISARYVGLSSTVIASAVCQLIGRQVDASNRWEVRKGWNPANQSVQARSLWGGTATTTDSISGVDATMGLPRALRARLWEDAIAVKEWITWWVWRGAYSSAAAYAAGDGVTLTQVVGSQSVTKCYVCIAAAAAGGVADPATDPTHWRSAEEPDWQIVQRLRPASAGFDGSTSATDENIETGSAGWSTTYLTCSLLSLSVTELRRETGNLVFNPQFEWRRPLTQWPLFWQRTGAPVTVLSGVGDRVVGDTILRNVPAGAYQSGMGIAGTGIQNGARIAAYDAGAGTITMSLPATSTANGGAINGTNWMGVSDVLGPGRHDAAMSLRRALHIRAFAAQGSWFCANYVWARDQAPNPFVLGRVRPRPAVRFPRSVEVSFWSKANIQLAEAIGTGLAIDLYYYDRQGRLLMQEGLSGVGPVDTYYRPLGPAGNGIGLWDWRFTRFYLPVRGGDQIALIRWQFGLHELCTGEAWILDPVARPVGGQV